MYLIFRSSSTEKIFAFWKSLCSVWISLSYSKCIMRAISHFALVLNCELLFIGFTGKINLKSKNAYYLHENVLYLNILYISVRIFLSLWECFYLYFSCIHRYPDFQILYQFIKLLWIPILRIALKFLFYFYSFFSLRKNINKQFEKRILFSG